MSLDAGGVMGVLFNCSQIILFMGGAILAFFICWKRNILSLDESAKFQMFEEE